MSYDESRAMVTHYARLGYARHVQTTCANAARALGNDPALSFWRAFGTIAEGGHSEAITKLEAMLTHADRDIELACMAAIVHAHKSARVVDEDSVERYETRVLSEEQSASATALVECATFYHLAGGPDAGRAKDTARRALDLAPGDVRAKTLLGWIEMTGRGDGDAGDEPGTGTGTASGVLTSARSATSRRRAAAAVRVFDEVLRSPDKGGEAAIDALLGKARAMTVLSRYDAAVDVMNELAARHPGFAPAASERAKARLAACDFEGAAENARRGLAEDPEDIECHRVMVFLSLSRDGDVQAARRQMASLEEALERREPRNAFLFLETSRDAARVAGGDAAVLASCGRLLEKARSLRPDDGAVSCESAYQARLAGKYGDAIELYAAAATAALAPAGDARAAASRSAAAAAARGRSPRRRHSRAMRLSGATTEEARPAPRPSLGSAAAKSSTTSRRDFEENDASFPRATTTSRGSVHARRASRASRASSCAEITGRARFFSGETEVSPGRARLALPGIATGVQTLRRRWPCQRRGREKAPRRRAGSEDLGGSSRAFERDSSDTTARARPGAGRPCARLCEPARTRGHLGMARQQTQTR